MEVHIFTKIKKIEFRWNSSFICQLLQRYIFYILRAAALFNTEFFYIPKESFFLISGTLYKISSVIIFDLWNMKDFFKISFPLCFNNYQSEGIIFEGTILLICYLVILFTNISGSVSKCSVYMNIK